MLKVDSLIDIAKESSAEQHRVACAAYDKRGRLLATGINQPTKSHPLQAKFAERAGFRKRIYLHAEISALIKCRQDPYTLQIVRIGPKEYAKPSCPCVVCQMAAIEAGVRELYYMNKDGEFITEYL